MIQAIASAFLSQLLGGVSGSVSGLDLSIDVELDLSALKQLKGKSRSAVFRAVNRSAKPVREAVISNANRIKRTGFLAKSIGTKTKMGNSGIVTVIGPKMSYSRKGPKSKLTGVRPTITPWRYAWLLEKGTVRSRVLPFLKPAWDQQGPGYLARVRAEIAAELAKVMST